MKIDNLELNIGDTLVSKVDYEAYSNKNKIFKDQRYTIEDIYPLYTTTTSINPATNQRGFSTFIYQIVIGGVHFREGDVKKYFHTLKELRKRKLDNIEKHSYENI